MAPPRTILTKEWFEARTTVDASGCWIWQRYCEPTGYGALRLGGEQLKIHRVSYAFHKGSIPRGIVVRHTCDVRNCCNPEHLVLGTHADNSADMVVRGRSAKGESQGSAKLTEDDVRSIRKDSRVTRVIAPEYGVSNITISLIKRRATWKHVSD